jgi:type IV pilus assembly protein PilA
MKVRPEIEHLAKFRNARITSKNQGFTLIELMIVIAVIAITLTLAVPTYANFMIRSKIAEALSISKAAKTAVAATCQEDLALTGLTPVKAGYRFEPSEFVAVIDINGTCLSPNIVVTTQNTGAQTDPVLTITGDFSTSSGRTTWVCASDGLNIHVPETCRS